MLTGKTWELFATLQRAIETRTPLEREITLNDQGRYVTLVSGETTASARKSGKGRVRLRHGDRGAAVRVGDLLASTDADGEPRLILVDYVRHFLDARGYRVDSVTPLGSAKRTLHVGGKSIDMAIEDHRRHWQVRLTDSDPGSPFLCARRHQMVLTLDRTLRLRKGDGGQYVPVYDALPIEPHREEELAEGRAGLLKRLRRTIFFGGSENLRLFYGEDGRVPAVKRSLQFTWKSSLSNGIMMMTSAGRVTGRLKELSFYASASGILAGLAAIWSEVRYQRRGLLLAAHMPDSRQASVSRQEKYRLVYELRGVRSWRNFERSLTTFSDRRTVEEYRRRKREIYSMVEAGENSAIPDALGLSSHADDKAQPLLRSLADGLCTIETDTIVAVELERLREIIAMQDESGEPLELIKPAAVPDLEEYLCETYPQRLRETFYMDANKELAAEIRHALRRPNENEIARVLKGGRDYLVPGTWRAFSCFCMLYLSGLMATYGDAISGVRLPDEVFLGYYLGFGAYSSFTSYGLVRIGSVVDLQGIIKELERDPRVNAMDTWNQYVSHINKVSLAASSIGMTIGLTSAVLSHYLGAGAERTVGPEGARFVRAAPLFAVEVPAFLLRCWAQHDWVSCLNGLARLYD